MKKHKFLFLIILTLVIFLRIYKLDSFPIGLYSDETAYGYNAYSLLKTGSDEFGEKWPLTLKSFGDYKPPMSAWLTIPSVRVFGLNEFSVRLPSALAWIITAIIIYFIAVEIFATNIKFSPKRINYIPEIAMAMIAISPWHLLFTRSSMLVGIEIMFTSAGFLFFLKGLKKDYFLYLGSLAFISAIYTYYGARITVTLLVLALILIFKKELWEKRKSFIAAFLLGFVMISPLLFSVYKNPLTLTGRASTVSIFYDPDIKLKLWQAHTLEGSKYPVLLSRFFNNKPYLYSKDFLRRYLQHFSYDFFVLKGDSQTPFNLQKMGVAYLPDIIFFLIGLYFLLKYRTKKIVALGAYLFISPIAASFTFITPAANRSFNMVVGWTILISFGIAIFLSTFRKTKTLIFALLIIFTFYFISFIYFLYVYYSVIPYEYPNQWHYGRKQIVTKVSALEDQYQNVVISDSLGPSYIWFLFYKKYDPIQYRQSSVIDNTLDEFGFINVKAFDKYKFVKPFKWEKVDKNPGTLYVSFEDDIPDNWIGIVNAKSYATRIVDKIYYPNGKIASKLVEIEVK